MVFYPVDKGIHFDMKMEQNEQANQKWINNYPIKGNEAQGLA